MSQEVNLSGLSISPLELDERERVFEAEGQWVEWVHFTREISAGADEKTRFALWVRLARKFEKVADRLEARQAMLASDLCLLSAKIWQREVERIDLAMKLFTKAYHFDPESVEALRGARWAGAADGAGLWAAR